MRLVSIRPIDADAGEDVVWIDDKCPTRQTQGWGVEERVGVDMCRAARVERVTLFSFVRWKTKSSKLKDGCRCLNAGGGGGGFIYVHFICVPLILVIAV